LAHTVITPAELLFTACQTWPYFLEGWGRSRRKYCE